MVAARARKDAVALARRWTLAASEGGGQSGEDGGEGDDAAGPEAIKVRGGWFRLFKPNVQTGPSDPQLRIGPGVGSTSRYA
jgi:hypothetical protein